jgi:menaquinone-dependent protoporphyrinogen oxidase
MRVLVTWGSTRGGTAEIGRWLAEDLRRLDVEADARPAQMVHDLAAYDAVIVGGALYANRWHPHARAFVRRHAANLRRIPVWMFSSGPLDASAHGDDLPPARQVLTLMERIGALGHRTFGGRLDASATGIAASAMAKKMSGDWRERNDVRAWASSIATALPVAHPAPIVAQPGRSPVRLVTYAAAGWGICAALGALVLAVAGTNTALVVRTIAAPIVFALVARRYFRPRGALDPLPAAALFAVLAAMLDVIAAAQGLGPARLGSLAVAWPLVLVAVWSAGAVVTMVPFPKRPAIAASA